MNWGGIDGSKRGKDGVEQGYKRCSALRQDGEDIDG